jgi:hypothetical protein
MSATTTFDVASEASLDAVLGSLDVGGALAGAGRSYTITLTSGFAETADPLAIDLATGESLTIDGGGNTIDGAGHRGLFAYAGTVTISALTLSGMAAAGGRGWAAGCSLPTAPP